MNKFALGGLSAVLALSAVIAFSGLNTGSGELSDFNIVSSTGESSVYEYATTYFNTSFNASNSIANITVYLVYNESIINTSFFQINYSVNSSAPLSVDFSGNWTNFSNVYDGDWSTWGNAYWGETATFYGNYAMPYGTYSVDFTYKRLSVSTGLEGFKSGTFSALCIGYAVYNGYIYSAQFGSRYDGTSNRTFYGCLNYTNYIGGTQTNTIRIYDENLTFRAYDNRIQNFSYPLTFQNFTNGTIVSWYFNYSITYTNGSTIVYQGNQSNQTLLWEMKNDFQAGLSSGVNSSLKCSGTPPFNYFGLTSNGQNASLGMLNATNNATYNYDVYAALNTSLASGYSLCLNSSSITNCTYLNTNYSKVISNLTINSSAMIWAYWNCTNANASKASYNLMLRGHRNA